MAPAAAIFKNQFKVNHFWFQWHSESHFLDTKWKWITKKKYIVMRWTVFCYFAVMTALSLWEINSVRWIFALTSLNYVLNTVYLLYAAANVTVSYLLGGNSAREDSADSAPAAPKPALSGMRFRFKAHWLLYNLSLTTCTFVFIAFWVMIAPHRKGGMEPSLHTFLVIDRHGINLLLMAIDFAVNRIPIRLLHFVYPSLFLGLYFVYNSIYWSQTGHLVYGKMLDYGSNGVTAAVLAVTGMFIAIPLIQLFWFTLTLCRKRVSVPREDTNANLEFHNM